MGKVKFIFLLLVPCYLLLTTSSFAKHTASRVVYGPNYLYVTIKGQRDVYVIDRTTLRLVKKVPISSPPCGGFITENGREFYMALGEDDAIAVMDTQTHTILRTISLKSSDVPKPARVMDPGGMAVSPDGRLLYIANESADSLSILNLFTGSVQGEIRLGVGPQAVALSPDGRKAFVTDLYSVHVVDTESRTVKSTLHLKELGQDRTRMTVLDDGEEVFQGPRDILISPDGRWAYVAVEDTGEVVVLDAVADRVIRKIPVGAYPGGLVLSPDGTKLYVAHRGGRSIAVVDTIRHEIIAKIAVGQEPWDIALSPDGDKAYVVNQETPSISVIDTKSFKVTTTIVLGAIKLKNLLPRGLRRMLYVWRKERKRVKHIPFASAIFAVLFLVPFAFTMLDREDSGMSGSNRALAGTVPGHKIAFESKRTGNWEIYVMNPDGTEQVRLTHTGAENRAPFWSPDGQRIAFVSDRDKNREVYLMNADGSNQLNLTRSGGEDFSPSWSPDGKKIAFVSMRDGRREVYVTDTEGENQIRLTSSGDNWNPNWSSDSRKLAFVSNRDGNNEIYLMEADGTHQNNLTKHIKEDGRGSHSWSPDGKKIAWVTNRDGNWEIYVMNADGGKPINVTRHPAEEGIGMFVWSPNGRQIAFISRRDNNNEEVYVVNSDGTGPINVSRSPGMDDVPLWSPDGKKLAFVSNRTGFDEIYVMDADGKHQVQLTFTRTKEDYPRWQP